MRAYIGVDGKARKIKRSYVGVDGVARKIKKAYIGIGGVARPCWSLEPAYYGKISSLSSPKDQLAGVGINKYALFAGGHNSSRYFNTIEVYNSLLGKESPLEMCDRRSILGVATVGEYVLFAGGYNGSGYTKTVDAYYISSLTRYEKSIKDIPDGGYGATGASLNGYALFFRNHTSKVDIVAYNSGLTQQPVDPFNGNAEGVTATTKNGNYALIAGGYSRKFVDAYNTSLTVQPLESLDSLTTQLTGVTLSDNILFSGGSSGVSGVTSNNVLKTTYVYNQYTLSKSYADDLVKARARLSSVAVGDFAIFTGGFNGNESVNTVDIYTATSLTKIDPDKPLSVGRNRLVGASIGNYALFAGGNTQDMQSAGITDTVEVYSI